jgi:hypothetical protein
MSVLGAAPDLIRPVVGFRQWRLAGTALRSLFADHTWRTPQLEARCASRGHPAPANDCACGIYAWYRPCPRGASAGTADYVAGAVVVWGRLELHATGLRGQYAQVVALALPLSRWAKRRRVLAAAEALEVPAVPNRALTAVACDNGEPVPDSLRPTGRRGV